MVIQYQDWMKLWSNPVQGTSGWKRFYKYVWGALSGGILTCGLEQYNMRFLSIWAVHQFQMVQLDLTSVFWAPNLNSRYMSIRPFVLLIKVNLKTFHYTANQLISSRRLPEKDKACYTAIWFHFLSLFSPYFRGATLLSHPIRFLTPDHHFYLHLTDAHVYLQSLRDMTCKRCPTHGPPPSPSWIQEAPM